MTMTADVLVREGASDADVERVRDAFAELGLTAQMRVLETRRSVVDVVWTVFAAVELQPFFSQLSADFADDSYQRLRTLVTKVIHRKSAPELDQAAEHEPKKVLVLMDQATGVQVVLEPDLPAESFKQLLSFDLATIKRGPLHYDLARQRWRSELDEQS